MCTFTATSGRKVSRADDTLYAKRLRYSLRVASLNSVHREAEYICGPHMSSSDELLALNTCVASIAAVSTVTEEHRGLAFCRCAGEEKTKLRMGAQSLTTTFDNSLALAKRLQSSITHDPSSFSL